VVNIAIMLSLINLVMFAVIVVLVLTARKRYGRLYKQFEPRAFQLASRWNSNRIFYRSKISSGTWEPWVEIYLAES
jgi:hypothetical protein